MKINLDENGLDMFFKPWQKPLIDKLLSENVEMKSGEAHEYVLSEGFKISRASVIFFLQDMEGEGLLLSREESGKGGMHAVYWGAKNIPELLTEIKLKLDDKIMEYSETLS